MVDMVMHVLRMDTVVIAVNMVMATADMAMNMQDMDMAENAWNAAQSELQKWLQKCLICELKYTTLKCWMPKNANTWKY